MAKILMFNIESKKAAGIKLLCSGLGIGYHEVDRTEYGKPIGVLLGIAENDGTKPDSDFDEEMLYLVDIGGDLLNALLYDLRRRKLGVGLKAVMTDTNIGFTSYELYRELSAEREAIQKGATAH